MAVGDPQWQVPRSARIQHTGPPSSRQSCHDAGQRRTAAGLGEFMLSMETLEQRLQSLRKHGRLRSSGHVGKVAQAVARAALSHRGSSSADESSMSPDKSYQTRLEMARQARVPRTSGATPRERRTSDVTPRETARPSMAPTPRDVAQESRAADRSESPFLRISRSVSAPTVQEAHEGMVGCQLRDGRMSNMYTHGLVPPIGDRDEMFSSQRASQEVAPNSMPATITCRESAPRPPALSAEVTAAVNCYEPQIAEEAAPLRLPEHGNLDQSTDNTAEAPGAETVRQQEGNEDELKSQLARAEADLIELARALHKMRRDHDEALVELRAERAVAAREQQAERERLRIEAAKERATSEDLREQLRREQQACQQERRRLQQLEVQLGLDQPMPRSPEEVAPVIAALETEALRSVDEETRHQFRRRLQLKWHPDKCVNAVLAKCVMQEFQRLPEWS